MVGDLVLAPFPYTDLSEVKIRPAVVLADVGMYDWILCEITSSIQMRAQHIPITQADLAMGRIRRDSWARPDRLTTLNERVFHRTLGRLTDTKLAEVTTAVRGLF